MVHHKYQITS